MFHGEKLRWLTAREKLLLSGVAVSAEQAEIAGIPTRIHWEEECGWHKRVGNGQQLQNVGLILLSTLCLCCVRLRATAPKDILFVEPCSIPDGLEMIKDGLYELKVGQSTRKLKVDAKTALALHKETHDPCRHCVWMYSCSHV